MISKEFFINTTIEDVERFDFSKFMKLENGAFDPMTSNVLRELKNLPLGGRIRVEGKDNRPDLISFDVYGTTQYYWVIMVYNGLQSFTDVKHGMELTYPSLNSLDDYFFNLKVRQNRVDRG